jgi:RNA-binding protein 5/10
LKTKKVSKVQKQQVANIEKWTEKQTELKAEAGPADATSTTTTSKIDKIRVAVPAPKIKKTAKGEPICAICKRKFLTVEKLGLHERVSELHRKNLAKLAEESSAKRKQAPPASAEYRDRAQKRRDLHTHLPDAVHGAAALAKANHAPPQRPTGTPVGESLESTIGNKMLQKMGWEYGSSLGSKARESYQNGKTAEATTQNNLRKDWERIEAMAGGALAHRPG